MKPSEVFSRFTRLRKPTAAPDMSTATASSGIPGEGARTAEGAAHAPEPGEPPSQESEQQGQELGEVGLLRNTEGPVADRAGLDDGVPLTNDRGQSEIHHLVFLGPGVLDLVLSTLPYGSVRLETLHGSGGPGDALGGDCALGAGRLLLTLSRHN